MEHSPHRKVVEVIFQGVKSFAGVNTRLECVLVNHISFGVIEILAFERLHQIETNRLYVDDSIVREELDRENSEVADYLLRRICISKYFPDSKLIELKIANNGPDPHIACSRPSGLKPYVFSHLKTGIVPKEALSAQDRWRIPIIFAKVSKGVELSSQDAQIWAAFTLGKCEEDVVASVASALSEQLPAEQSALQETINDTIQAATVPSNTPFPSHNEMPGRMVSSRSFSDFSKLDGSDDEADLFVAPVLARTQSHSCAVPRSPTAIAAAAGVSPRRNSNAGEIGPPSPRKNRAPLPRSGTNSKLGSPTAKSGIADMAAMAASVVVAPVMVQVDVSKPAKKDVFVSTGQVQAEKSDKAAGHKRVHSLSVLDSLADALQRGLGLQSHVYTREPYVRTDTASSESDLGVERGVSVEDNLLSSSSGSSKKRPGTPPATPRAVLDPFPPHTAAISPVRRHSYSANPHALSPQAQGVLGVTAQAPLKTSPQSAKSALYAPSPRSPYSPPSTGQPSSSGSGSEGVREGVRERHQSRSPSPSFLRSLASWGGGGSKVAPGGWEDEENSF